MTDNEYRPYADEYEAKAAFRDALDEAEDNVTVAGITFSPSLGHTNLLPRVASELISTQRADCQVTGGGSALEADWARTNVLPAPGPPTSMEHP
jgi:hypothetical protein